MIIYSKNVKDWFYAKNINFTVVGDDEKAPKTEKSISGSSEPMLGSESAESASGSEASKSMFGTESEKSVSGSEPTE